MLHNSRSRNLHESCRKIASPVTNASRHPFRRYSVDVNQSLAGSEYEIAQRSIAVEVVQSDSLMSGRSRDIRRLTDRCSCCSGWYQAWTGTSWRPARQWSIARWLAWNTSRLHFWSWWQFWTKSNIQCISISQAHTHTQTTIRQKNGSKRKTETTSICRMTIKRRKTSPR